MAKQNKTFKQTKKMSKKTKTLKKMAKKPKIQKIRKIQYNHTFNPISNPHIQHYNVTYGKIHKIGCPPCEHLKIVWGDDEIHSDKNKNIMNFGKLHDYNRIDIESNNVTTESYKINNLLKNEKLTVNSYPTIYKIIGDKLHYYDGNRSYEDLTTWLSRKY
jgi:hypothetical protein